MTFVQHKAATNESVMVFEIHCAVIINTNKIEKATRLFEVFKTKIPEMPLKNYTNNVYWKDRTKHKAEFDFIIVSDSTGGLLEQLITMMSGISSNWQLMIPSNFDSENFEMSCISNEVMIKGIDWINFEV